MPQAYRTPAKATSPGDSPHEQLQAVSSGVKPHCLIIVSFGANTPYLTDTVDNRCRWKYTTLVRYYLDIARKEFASRPAPRFVLHDGHVARQYNVNSPLGANPRTTREKSADFSAPRKLSKQFSLEVRSFSAPRLEGRVNGMENRLHPAPSRAGFSPIFHKDTERLAVKEELDQLCSRHEIPFLDYLPFEDGAGLLVKKREFESSLEKFLREEGLIR